MLLLLAATVWAPRWARMTVTVTALLTWLTMRQ